MSTLFDDLKQGLQEAIAYEKGQGTARIKTYTLQSCIHVLSFSYYNSLQPEVHFQHILPDFCNILFF